MKNEVIESFLIGKKKRKGNITTDGRSLYLFDNVIAIHKEDGMYVSNAGWDTVTTRKYLNMLPNVKLTRLKKVTHLNDMVWDGDFVKVNNFPAPKCDTIGECFDMTLAYKDGNYDSMAYPIYNVYFAVNTGNWDDSPYPMDEAMKGLNEQVKILKKNKIPYKCITLETTNIFCLHHFIIVPPKYYDFVMLLKEINGEKV